MRILSLAPFITEAIVSFGLEKQLVGITSDCPIGEKLAGIPLVDLVSDGSTTVAGLAAVAVGVSELKSINPDIIFSSLKEEPNSNKLLLAAKAQVKLLLGDTVKFYSFNPRNLEQVFETFNDLGQLLASPKGHDISQRLKAQLMNWSDNFYERMKNKRVCFLSSVNPLQLAGFWIPDMIAMCSAISQLNYSGSEDLTTTWSEIIKFRPDVLVVAVRGQDLRTNAKNFKQLETMPDWESLPAVKRGEVIFTDGSKHFYTASSNLLESMSVLVSAIAGFDSGYIAPRESFYRLRWLEMQRHKI